MGSVLVVGTFRSEVPSCKTDPPSVPMVHARPSLQAARGEQDLAGHPRRLGGGEEHGHRGDVTRLADAAEGRLRRQLFLEVASWNTLGASALGVDDARIDRVHSNLPRPELLR